MTAFAAIAGYGVFVNQKTDEMSELTLANIEALAQSESSSGGCRFRIDAIYNIDSLAVSNTAPCTIINIKSDLRLHELIDFDDLFLAIGIIDSCKYMVLNGNLEPLFGFGTYVYGENRNISKANLALANYGKTFKSPSGKYMSSIVYNSSILSLHKRKHDTFQLIWDNPSGNLQYTMKGQNIIKDGPIGYKYAALTDKYLFALSSGKEQNMDAMADYANTIQIYTLKGEHIKNVTIPIPCFAFCVDANNNDLYTVIHDPEPAIVKYPIGNYLQ